MNCSESRNVWNEIRQKAGMNRSDAYRPVAATIIV